MQLSIMLHLASAQDALTFLTQVPTQVHALPPYSTAVTAGAEQH